MKVMLIDGGARGHALALAYLQDSSVQEVLVAPGNDGMCFNQLYGFAKRKNILIDSSVNLKKPETVPAATLALAQQYKPDIIEVAQDDALAAGTVDALQKVCFRVFGPTQAASQIEWDKAWAREFMTRHVIQTPSYAIFTNHEEAKSYALTALKKVPELYVKASGLCAGKGVVKATDEASIDHALSYMQKLGAPARTFLIEHGIQGEEFSYHVLVDGKNVLPLESAQDNKRVFVRDEGENTGGMGAHAPAFITRGLEERIESEIIKLAVQGLAAENRPYRGVLYLGGMVETTSNTPYVLEFNARWGDPECHVLLPAIRAPSYYEIIAAAIEGKLDKIQLKQDNLYRVSIVAASLGYPASPIKDKRVWIDYENLPADTHLLSAGIKTKDNTLYTDGGRVLACVAAGRDILQARTRALQARSCVIFEDNTLHYRHDIAQRDVERFLKAS